MKNSSPTKNKATPPPPLTDKIGNIFPTFFSVGRDISSFIKQKFPLLHSICSFFWKESLEASQIIFEIIKRRRLSTYLLLVIFGTHNNEKNFLTRIFDYISDPIPKNYNPEVGIPHYEIMHFILSETNDWRKELLIYKLLTSENKVPSYLEWVMRIEGRKI